MAIHIPSLNIRGHRPRGKPLGALGFLGALAVFTLGACSSSTDDSNDNGGASSDSGGSFSGGTGGAPNTGGTNPGTGGVAAVGGSLGTGGSNTTGGAPGTGGTGGSTGGGNSGGSGGSDGSGGSSGVTCPSTVLSPGDSDRTITVGGQTRNYVLHVPSSYDGNQAVPLIVDFHPLGGSGPAERSDSPYPAQTDSEGVIMAFPSGNSGPSGGAWNVGPCCVAGVDDVEFAKALVDELKQEACIDPKRVYAAGFSMGGGMSHYLACHGADVFAAVAPAAFDLLEENVQGCQPSRPITVVSFRSTGDPIVPYNGGYSAVVSGMPITFLGAQATHEKWAEINNCTGSPTDSGNGCSTYENCQDGVTVTLCTKQGGGHDYGNASVAWPILKQHTLP